MTDIELVHHEAKKIAPGHCHVTASGTPSCFRNHKLFVATGNYKDFDFVSLPGGSFGYFSVRNSQVAWLRRGTDAIQNLLREEWNDLPSGNLCELVGFLMAFYEENPIQRGHWIIANKGVLDEVDSPDRVVDKTAIAKVANEMESISVRSTKDTHTIRFLSICGWMHSANELGLHTMKIASNGLYTVSERRVLCTSVFSKLPSICY